MQRRLSFFQRIATAVSGLDPRRNGTSDPEGLGRGLARSSQKPGSVRRSIQIVAALSTMTAASCLITTDPEFEPPAKTAPFFLPDTASPNADRVLQINDGDSGIKFSAFMQSEDAGAELSARLYLDYGGAFPSGYVYDLQIPAAQPVSGSWSDGPREVSATYFGEFRSMSEGCHRFTLMVIHGTFDGVGCPKEEGDYATQTWIVQNCGANELEDCPDLNVGDCPPVAENPSFKCRTATAASGNEGGSP